MVQYRRDQYQPRVVAPEVGTWMFATLVSNIDVQISDHSTKQATSQSRLHINSHVSHARPPKLCLPNHAVHAFELQAMLRCERSLV